MIYPMRLGSEVSGGESEPSQVHASGTDAEATAPEPFWTVLVVEDTEDYRVDAARELEGSDVAHGSPPRVVAVASFTEAAEYLIAGTVDVIVLDVRDDAAHDDHAGEELLARIKETRFIPVVFYTAYASRVADLATAPVIQVVGKEEGTDTLVEAVRRSFDSHLPLAVRSLTDHVREVTREYLWEHMADQWSALEHFDASEKTQLLVNRLARSLELTVAQAAVEGLQGPLGVALAAPSLWHPSRVYVIPPMGTSDDTGDLLLNRATGAYWLQLTPACDLAQAKADRHLLVKAEPLLDVEPFKSWKATATQWSTLEEVPMPKGGFPKVENDRRKAVQSTEKTLRGACSEVLRGANDRYFHLPQFLTVPDLLLDMQKVYAPESSEVSGWERVASLAPPWPHVIVSRFNRQVGRFGFDDPDVGGVLERLRGS